MADDLMAKRPLPEGRPPGYPARPSRNPTKWSLKIEDLGRSLLMAACALMALTNMAVRRPRRHRASPTIFTR